MSRPRIDAACVRVGVRVRAPDGRAWHVYRRIRWPRRRTIEIDWLRMGDIAEFSITAGLVALFIGVVVSILVAIFLPLIVFAFEAGFVIIGLVLLQRPWLVVASTPGPPEETQEWLVRGPLASRAAVKEVARELESGVEAAP